MSTFSDEHPDELLDRVARGERLTAGEQARLTMHLRRCAACRFLRTVKVDLRREEAGDRDPAKVAALVASTLAALSAPAAGVAFPAASSSFGQRRVVPHAGSRAGGIRRAVGVAAIFVIGLGGLAVASHWQRPRDALAPAPAAIVVPSPPARAALGTDGAPGDDAAALFAKAKDARLRGRTAETRRLYQRLWERFASTAEGQVGRAVFGRWLLDRGEPAAALPAFADYLRMAPSGALEEEVRVGIAEALEKVGRAREARAAWRALVARYPGSAYVLRARGQTSAGPRER